MNYKNLFITRFLDQMHYQAVVYEQDTGSFYHALFECKQTGGALGYYMKDIGNTIDFDEMCRLAHASEEEAIAVSGRPAEKIDVIRKLEAEENKQNTAFSFEKKVCTTDLIMAGGQPFIRVIKYDCSAEGNGRPVYVLLEDYYEIKRGLIDFLTPENWRSLARKTAGYSFRESGTGVLF